MICRMAKPEEVIVVVNENNEAVRELVKDTDSMVLYKTMRETLGKGLMDRSWVHYYKWCFQSFLPTLTTETLRTR